MDATTPTTPDRRQSRDELTPLLRTPNISDYAEVDLSPSFQNLHSRLGSLHDTTRENVSVSTPARVHASPVLKRARFESPEPPPDISSDFLTRKLREANTKGSAPRHHQQTTPPPSSSGVHSGVANAVPGTGAHTSTSSELNGVLIAKQTEINELTAELQRLEQKSAHKANEARQQLQEERKYSQDRIAKLEAQLRSVQQDAQSLSNRNEAEIGKLRSAIQSYKSQETQYEIRVADLTEERDNQAAGAAKLQEKLNAANVRASRLETRINELEAAVRTARTSAEAAQDKEISATLRCDEAQSLKNGLLQQISNLETKLEDMEHEHSDRLDEKQSEIHQWRIKLSEREKELKNARDTISIFKAAEEKLSQENENLHKLIADEKVLMSRCEERLRVAKGEIAELKDQIQSGSFVYDLRRKLESQHADLERASGILEEREQRIKRLEHELSEAGRSAEFSRMNTELQERNQVVQHLNRAISELKSKQREDSISQNSARIEIENIKEDLRVRDQALAEAQRAVVELQSHADTATKQARNIKAEYDRLDQNYKRVYADYLSEIEKLREEARTELHRLEQSKMEANSRHLQELEEVSRQKDKALLAQQQELEQRFIDLSTQSGNSLAEALRDQRQQLERDYNQHLQRVDQNTEERIAQLKELAHLEVNEYKRELESHYNVHKDKVEKLEEECAVLDRKLATTLKAFKLVFEYFTASKARNDFIMDDLIFIKRIATSCLDQIEQDDYRRLAALGITPTRPRTFAGVATFILAVGRLQRMSRPQVPEKLKYEFERFLETRKVD